MGVPHPSRSEGWGRQRHQCPGRNERGSDLNCQPRLAPCHIKCDAIRLQCGNAIRSAALLRSGRPPLRYLKLLPPAAPTRQPRATRSFLEDSRRNTVPLLLRSERICRHARTHPSPCQRASRGKSFDRHAGRQTAFRKACSLAGSGGRRSVATALLRLQRVDRKEENRKASVSTPKSSWARTSCRTRRVALEQLSVLHV